MFRSRRAGAAAEAHIRRRWYGRPGWLRTFAPIRELYAFVVRRRFARRSLAASIPTLVVGNIVAGGAGKTPVVMALARRLRAAGAHPGIVSRGYGGSGRAPRLVRSQDDPTVVGDEPLLLTRALEVPVAVARARLAAVELLKPWCDFIVSDDGLQHYDMARSAEIAVFKAPHGIGNGELLPVGPLREPLDRLQSVDLVLCVGADLSHAHDLCRELRKRAGVPAMAATVRSAGWRLLPAGRLGSPERLSLEAGVARLRRQKVIAFAGIAHPEDFFAELNTLAVPHDAVALADHGAQLPSLAADAVLVMTAKDQVRFGQRLEAHETWVLEQEIDWAAETEVELDRLLARLLSLRSRGA